VLTLQTGDLHLDPAALNPIIEQEPHQVRHAHVPLGGAGSDEKDEEVLFLQFDISDDQSKVDPGKEEDDTQDDESYTRSRTGSGPFS